MKREIWNENLRVLIVCSANSGKVVPYIKEQVEAIANLGVEVDYFLIKEQGLLGYWRNRQWMLEKIAEFKPDIIHAHYGLSGLLANLQRKIPVVTTYHGSDINIPKVQILSKISIKLSKYNIFVAQKLIDLSKPRKNYVLLPCGINLELFRPLDKILARKYLGLYPEKYYVLFAGSFSNAVKNYPLANETMSLLPNVELVELKGYSREQVVWLMNAVDASLVCSFSEGSPQFVKEALACNCPIVSTPVGDVPNILNGIDGCFLVDYNAFSVKNALNLVLQRNNRIDSIGKVLAYDNMKIAEEIMKIYEKVLNVNA